MPGLGVVGGAIPTPNYSSLMRSPLPTNFNNKSCRTFQIYRISSSNSRNRTIPSYNNPQNIMFTNYFQRAKPFAECICRSLFNMTKMNPSSSSLPSVQVLYDLCKNMFNPSTTYPLSSQAVNKLSSVLDTIGPSDVGLEEQKQNDRGHGAFGLNMFNRVDRWAQPITYVDVHENNNFTMCIFCFPTSSVIPLHDHPGMTVFSKLLYGSLHVKAYDWVEPPRILKSKETGHAPVRLAKLAVDKVVTAPCNTSVLYPKSGGNLHCFTAVTPCAVLDILAPPYAESGGRKCTYYQDYPYSTFGTGSEISDGKEEEYAWLAEVETPKDLYMCPGRYTDIHFRMEEVKSVSQSDLPSLQMVRAISSSAEAA